MIKKNIHKVKLGQVFIYKGTEYRRMGSQLRGINLLTGKPKIFLGTEIVEVNENPL